MRHWPLLLLCLIPLPSAAILINNGDAPPNPANIVDFPDGALSVNDAGCAGFPCATPGDDTVVAVIAGASISGATFVLENSKIEMSGGSLNDVSMFSSVPGQTLSFLLQGGSVTTANFVNATIEGGTIGTLSATDTTMSGGTVTGTATGGGGPAVDEGFLMSGGSIVGLYTAAVGNTQLSGTASVNGISSLVSGSFAGVSDSASVGDILVDDGGAFVVGGTVGRIEVTGDGTVNLGGGSIAGPLLPGPASSTGSFNFFGLRTSETAPLHDFQVDGVPVTMTYVPAGMLFLGSYTSTSAGSVLVTGTFESGEPVSHTVEFSEAGQTVNFLQLLLPAVPMLGPLALGALVAGLIGGALARRRAPSSAR